uniref:ribosomal protein S11 n=1 Tax=Prosopanche panguanensis TaxID=2952649 RepID=UPI002114EE03|nr:ribosomal protein S11 [Prosopanche panguanensis]USN93704.1 ribosomal protein S11 [Prosopanche panguanensis]
MIKRIKIKPIQILYRHKHQPKINLLEKGIIIILASFNNTRITIMDEKNKLIFTASTGMYEFKNTQKGTPFAAKTTAKNVFNLIKINSAEIRIKGIGAGITSVLQVIKNKKIKIYSILDITPLSHNGCKSTLKKVR